MGAIFLYDVEFVPHTNPPGRKEEFEAALRGHFAASGLDYLMSALGGMVRTRGVAYRKGGDATPADREALAEFLRAQPVLGAVRLGGLEEETEATDFFRDITEWVFAVDNLTIQTAAPEPGTNALIVLGAILGLFGARKRLLRRAQS